MKKFLLSIGIILVILILTIVCVLKIYLPSTGSVILGTTGRIGNQLFQYSASLSLAKQTNSKLYILIDRPKEEITAFHSDYHALGEFNIPKENIIYKNKLNSFYFDTLYKQKSKYNKIYKFIRKILSVKYINEANFFHIVKTKNNKTLVMQDYFESPVFFQQYKKELLEQFRFINLDTKKLQPIINEVSSKNAVCIHVRRGDIVKNTGRFISIDYQKQAIKLAEKLIEEPRFFVFSDDQVMVKQELQDIKKIEFIDRNSSMEDLYIMSQCANNIITISTFSWWAAYLNQNNGLVIAPYHSGTESFFLSYTNITDRYNKRSLYAGAFLENWVLLDDHPQDLSTVAKKYISDEAVVNKILSGYSAKEFNIYSGNRIELEICKNKGDFQDNLCFLHKNKPTVVTAYYKLKSKHTSEEYIEWARNFLQIPFNLIVYTDKENAGWIKRLRGDLPMVLIEKTLEEFENYKLKDKYQEYAERDQEIDRITGKKLHSAELFMIWNEKIKFVNDAIRINPYKSNFFAWCDIEIFRDKKYIQNNFTNDKLMIRDKITLVLNNDFENKELDTKLVDDTVDRVQTGVLIGDIRSWQVYNYLYDVTRQDLIKADILAGKNQTVMSNMVIRYPELFNLIYPEFNYAGNRWWYLLLYYSNKTVNSHK